MTVSDDGQARYVFMINILENNMFSRNKVLPDKKSILRTKVQSIFSLKSNYNHDAVGQKSWASFPSEFIIVAIIISNCEALCGMHCTKNLAFSFS